MKPSGFGIVDKRTVGYKCRKLSMVKGTQAMLTLLDAAKKAAIPAKYVLFDSWFSSPSTLHAVKNMGYDVIGMVKKTPKMFFRYNGEDMALTSIYQKWRKAPCFSYGDISHTLFPVKSRSCIRYLNVA